eukprot:GHVR01004392.1.p1 GENE.GHVR01004392.1~~GHVR01004392.1.p1  ORF type:complete len:124 (-),score=28.34 GHVR01004392.1:465-836(-)
MGDDDSKIKNFAEMSYRSKYLSEEVRQYIFARFISGLMELPDKVPAEVLEMILKDCDTLKLELPLTSEVLSFLDIVGDADVSVEGGAEAILKFKTDNENKEVGIESDEKINNKESKRVCSKIC